MSEQIPSFSGSKRREQATLNISNKSLNAVLREIDEEIKGMDIEDKESVGLVTSKTNWATSEGNYWAIGKTCETVPCALYEAAYSDSIGYFLKTLSNNMDDIIDLPDSESDRLIKEIAEFTTLKSSFEKHGFLYKRGILLWGPPGSGKTVTIQQLIRLFTKTGDGIAVMCKHPGLLMETLRDFRKVEPDRQVLVVIEDLDALIEMYRESDFLNMLDGEAQLQNVVYVATTNYPEMLDNRFKDRPSRFDTIRKIDMPSEDARRVYLQVKLPEMKAEEIEVFVIGSKGYSVAYLRELIVLTQCFKLSTEEAFKRLDMMRDNMPDSSKAGNSKSFGFSVGE